MDLISLAYTSILAPAVDRSEVDRIVQQARINNPLDGVTGVLAFDGRRFVQVLEGSEDAIVDMEARLRGDPRHVDMVVQERQPVERRVFADWSMGHVQLDSGGAGDGETPVDRALRRDLLPIANELLLEIAGQR